MGGATIAINSMRGLKIASSTVSDLVWRKEEQSVFLKYMSYA